MSSDDMFQRLAQLIAAVEAGDIKEEPALKAKKKKKKSRKKSRSRSVSPVKQNESPSQLASPAPQAPGLDPLTYPAATISSPAARRPVSALPGYPNSRYSPPQAQQAYTSHQTQPARPSTAHARPKSAYPATTSPTGLGRSRPQSAAPLRPYSATHTGSQPSPPRRPSSGPDWKDKTAPKYTKPAVEIEPEIGTVPGNYRSPPWDPKVADNVDPLRQELPRPILEGRFKNVLAVPAHVLAQSLYHSDSPTARARIRQLQEDLKTARMDRKQAMQEKAQAQASLREHAEYSAWAEQEVGALRAQVAMLHEQLEATQHAARAASKDHEAAEEAARAARLAARDHEVAELQAELDAARDTIDDLRAQLKRALQLAAR